MKCPDPDGELGLDGEWDQDDDFQEAWDAADDLIQARVKATIKALGRRCYVHYDAFQEDPIFGIPADNLDEIAQAGPVILTSSRYDSSGRDYASPVSVNPTWMEVAVCANDAIRITRDRSHIYLEAIRWNGVLHDGVRVFELIMGS